MNDFTIVNLQDLTTATGLTENDFLAIGQGSNALTKATISQIGSFIGVSASVVLGDKNIEPTEPSFAFAEAGTYPEWGNVEIIGDLGILIFDGANFYKTEINFIASGVVEQGNTQAVSGGEVYENIKPIDESLFKTIPTGTNLISELTGSSVDDDNLWGIGYLLPSGSILYDDLWRYSKNFYSINEISHNWKIAIHGTASVCFYDENKNFLSSIQKGDQNINTYMILNDYSTPVNARFFRISHYTGSSLLTSEIYTKTNNDIKVTKSDVFLETKELGSEIYEILNIKNYDPGVQWIGDLANSDVNNTDIWGVGYFRDNGTILGVSNWRYSKNFYKIYKGTYEIRTGLSGSASMIIYDNNKDVKQYINATGSSPIKTMTIEVLEDGYFRTSHPQVVSTSELSFINNTPIIFDVITTENIENFSNNSAFRNTYRDTYRPKIKRPLVTIISDDGHNNNLDWFVPILDEFKVKATFSIIGDRVKAVDENPSANDYMNSNQLRQLHLNGHEIASHTWTHTSNWSTVLTLDQIEEEMSRTKVFLEKISLKPVNMFISPYGLRRPDIDNIISKYYDANFISGYATLNPIPLDNYFVNRISFDCSETDFSLLWDSSLKPAIDESIEENNWLVFAIHPQYSQYKPGNPDYLSRRDELRTLLQYCEDNNVEVVCAGVGYEYFKNFVNIGVRRYDAKIYQLGMDGSEYNENYFNETI